MWEFPPAKIFIQMGDEADRRLLLRHLSSHLVLFPALQGKYKKKNIYWSSLREETDNWKVSHGLTLSGVPEKTQQI